MNCKICRILFIASFVCSMLALAKPVNSQATVADYERAGEINSLGKDKVFRTRIRPLWSENSNLIYRVDIGKDKHEWVLVESDGKSKRYDSKEKAVEVFGKSFGQMEPLRLSKRPKFMLPGGEVKFTFHNKREESVKIYWLDGSKREFYVTLEPNKEFSVFSYEGHVWEVKGAADKVLGFVTVPTASLADTVEIDGRVATEDIKEESESTQSPSSAWDVQFSDHNIRIVDRKTKELVVETKDGNPGATYANSRLGWSPDGAKLVVFRKKIANPRKIQIVESSPDDQVQPRVMTIDYPKPGDEIDRLTPVLINCLKREVIAIPDKLFSDPWQLLALGDSPWETGVTWADDSTRFLFAYNQRGHQLMRVISVDVNTAEPSTLWEDTSDTFIDYSGKFWAKYLPTKNQILWMSERDGWNHLYIHDATSGAVIRQVTKGQWVVRKVERVDEELGRVLLKVSGRNVGEDPYHEHYLFASLVDGTETVLTAGDGNHTIAFSPDGSRYLDQYSRIDMPTVTELRDSADGSLLAELERGDATELLACGWKMPNRFHATGRDGKTEIWGAIWRPTNFDPGKKYPVIENIYAGPTGISVPKNWNINHGSSPALAEIGFVVVEIDGMGTNYRSKAFHNVCHKNLKDAGFPDRIAWMKAAAVEFPYMDLSRVGIYGGSAGGQNAVAALIWHGDFYKAAVADCGCHDNRMDKVWWNEQWMGYPIDESYAANSNVVHAGKIKGKLMLTVGELDTNVDPASTMQVANALIEANIDFDLMVVPGAGHGVGEIPYLKRRRADFFVRNLWGLEPRDSR